MTSPQPAQQSDRVVVDLGRQAGISYFEGLYGKLQRHRAQGARIPGVDEIRSDLRQASGPFPARVATGKQDQGNYLRLYVKGSYVLVLNVSKYGQGYIIGDVHPLALRDQDDIVRGGFALAASAWRLYDHPRELQGLDARWPTVQAAWRSRPRPDGTAADQRTLPRRHEDYLDDLQILIDKAREVELTSKPSDRICRYQRITPAAAKRRNAQSVYKFQLMGESWLVTGRKVHIDEHPDLRGEISQIRESLITVKFERAVDFNRIPQLGAFVASPNTTSQDKQAEAVEILRERRSQNQRLLDVLVDHAFQPFRPATARPRERLDPSQEAAFRKALAVPDIALVQGPPGTGKTRTIRQVVWECATRDASKTPGSTRSTSPGSTRKNPVLVSAYTNQAVDNVLKGLPEELTVIRTGSGVTADCEHLTLAAQAADLQRRILDRTAPVLDRYANADSDGGVSVQLLRELVGARARLDEAITRERQAESELSSRDAEITAPLRSRLQELDAELVSRQAVASDRDRLAARAAARQARAAKTAELPVLGRLFRGRAERRVAETAAVTAAAAHAAGEVASTKNLQDKARQKLDRRRASDPGLAKLRALLQEIQRRRESYSARAVTVARRLADSLGDAGTLPPVSPDPAVLGRFHDAAAEAIALARRRLFLLRKWRSALERRTEQLYPELIRYADVVGATCIGAASSKDLSDVTFDLAIIDEAGQITTPNLLVPLVRAERAVLVGDHVQLPPYAEQELAVWARGHSPGLADLTTKSAFEMLFSHVPAGSRQMLAVQRRMPKVIGDFISGQFYDGQLDTDTQRADRDELFASTMAFIDTAGLPDRQRRERRPRPGEPWPDRSSINDAEARLIASLVAYYDTRGSDWVVIVPFKAQAGVVSGLLAQRLGDEEQAASRVASIDSFQGGEHDTVIFGFTRSNGKGSVGFFSEVRRSNVAFSRSRQRLIMVGDLSTLLNATDAGFRSLMTALHDHVRRRGDIRGYQEVAALLAREGGR